MTNWCMARSSARCGVVMVLAGLAAGSIFPAQDIPPPIPTPDLDQTTYPVIGIIDGHTVRVLIEGEEHKIVLCGVSTPATEAGRDQLQRFLEHLLRGESVFLEYEAAPGGDSPDRRSAHVFRAPDGLFVNLEIVRQGYGKVRQEATCAHLRVLRHYERRAKEIEKGVWAPPSQPERVSKAREAPSQPAGDAGDIIVYVTKSGTKYHRKDCYHLRKSSRPMTLREAVAKGYEPCSHCKPPTLQGP